MPHPQNQWSEPPIFRFLLQAQRMSLQLKKAALERQIESLLRLVESYEDKPGDKP